MFLRTGKVKVILLLFIASLYSCQHLKKNHSHEQVPDAYIRAGKKLAEAHCQSCHMLPDPSLLNASSWETGVLPAMGPHLGIFDFKGSRYPSSLHDPALDKNYYPSKPVVTPQEWQYIIDYYTSVSPDALPAQQRKYAVKSNESAFTALQPVGFQHLPTTCFVEIDTISTPRQLVMADMITRSTFRFDQQLQLKDSFQNASPMVSLERHPNDMMTCNIGIMNPNNGKYGSAIRLVTDEKGKMKADSSVLLTHLARPVQVSSADFNRDGRMDYLVCEFGHLEGALSWMENTGNGHFTRHVIRAVPGAIKAYIADINHDMLPDICVLFAQAEEGIFLFINKGHGKFEQEQVLRFPPIFGSSYFEFADFNKDGYPDILYTGGDNADFSPVLKPYHGLYIFLNDGSNHFKQSYFFPMYGCFKAMARDFDGDGDLDIAAISFFADYTRHPEESFIYLENKGGLDFQPWSVPGTNAGRWLTMDAGDIDGDGRTDLILGNFSVAPASIPSAQNWKKGPPFLVLKNILPHH